MDIFLLFFQLIHKALLVGSPFIILLGVLIFIHELGHFLVARYFGVKVKVFSLGFGPKILKYKKGDTLYCLSLFPLGGYVKMSGDNPLEELTEEEKSEGFLYKKVYQKWLIAFAGPFMNLVFTLLAFFMLSKIGTPSLPAILGDIKKESSAYQSGFRSGDTVLAMNGEKLLYYEDLAKNINKGASEEAYFTVKDKDNQLKEISVKIQKTENQTPFSWKKEIGSIEGLTPLSNGLRVGVVFESLAYKKGLRTFDKILKINGKPLRYWRDLESAIKNQQDVEITFERENQKKTAVFSSLNRRDLDSLILLGLEPSFLYIERVGPNTPASQAGLKSGDRLVSIQGQTIKSWEQVLEQVKNSLGSELKIKYKREGELKTVFISPKSLFVEGNIKNRFMLGVVSGAFVLPPPSILRKRSFFESFTYSIYETKNWLGTISVSFLRLIQGKVSVRTLGGPIAIGRVAHSSFQQGLASFLFLMAFISLNLFFLNLLPIPVLDGGYLLFFTLEGILGRPLSVKKLLLAQQGGLLFILAFMGLAVFNDIYNFLKAW